VVLGFPGTANPLSIQDKLPRCTRFLELIEENPIRVLSPRGAGPYTDGVLWAVSWSGHFASFDRRLCRGRSRAGSRDRKACPEGWKLYNHPRSAI